MHAIRVLYLPNELGNFRQEAGRRSLEQLRIEGYISDLKIVSLLNECQQRGREHTTDLICSELRKFKPHTVLIQHPSASKLTGSQLEAIRASLGGAKLIYHEMDAFGGLAKPLPRLCKRLAAISNTVYTCGTGTLVKNFKKCGASDVRYVPHGVDLNRTSGRKVPGSQGNNVVLIGNRSSATLPWKYLPGAKDRARLVSMLEDNYGNRFQAWGSGWKGKSASGYCPYDESIMVSSEAAVTVNWDHYPDEPNYFSDRLPMSMFAGTPHITTYHPGFDTLLPKLDGLIFAKSITEIPHLVNKVLATPTNQRAEWGLEMADFAAREMTQDSTYRTIIADAIGRPISGASSLASSADWEARTLS